MRRQRNMSERKEQKTPEKEVNKMETSNLPDAEFKKQVIRILNELRGRVDQVCENFNNVIRNIKWTRKHKKNQSEMKNTLTKINNTLKGINNRVEPADKESENTQQNIKNRKES